MWLAIDERKYESSHETEPHYNKLQRKWVSSHRTYLAKGTIQKILGNSLNDICCINIEKFDSNNEPIILEIHKIY